MARVVETEKSYTESLTANEKRNLLVVCERLYIDCPENATKEEIAKRIKLRLVESPMLLGLMLQKEAIDLLEQLWSQELSQIVVERCSEELQQLTYLGFVHVGIEIVEVNLEAKDLFFFGIKGKKSREDIERYNQWEKVLFGMLFVYGVLDIYYLHDIFCQVLDEDVPYPELEMFIIRRITFWGTGVLLRNKKDMRLFFASQEVEDRSEIFRLWNEHPQLTFCQYERDEYEYLGAVSGVYPWDGIHELFEMLLDIIDDRYQATVIIKTLIVTINNNESLVDVVNRSNQLVDECDDETKKEMYQCIKEMYESVPVFGFKGYCRKELAVQEDFFQVIDGGKE